MQILYIYTIFRGYNMNIETLNELNLNIFELEYAISDRDLLFLLHVPEEDILSFKDNDSAEFYMSITNENNMHFYIDIPNIKNAHRVGFEFSNNLKSSTELSNILKILKSNPSITFLVFSKSTLHSKVLSVYKNDISYLESWINNTYSSTAKKYDFQNNYKDVPCGYLIPQKTETKFWFISKVSNDNLTIAKNHCDSIDLKADIFEGELVLYLAQDKNLISVIQLADNIIDEDIRNDFKLLLKEDTISILLNTEGASDDNIIHIKTTLDKASIERIKYYLSI